MELEKTILSETMTQKNKCHMFRLICDSLALNLQMSMYDLEEPQKPGKAKGIMEQEALERRISGHKLYKGIIGENGGISIMDVTGKSIHKQKKEEEHSL